MSYEAIVFDLDGTLVNTLSDISWAVNQALSHYSFPQRSESEIQGMIGNGAFNLIKKALPYGDFKTAFVNEVLETYRRIYDDNLIVYSRPYEGVLNTLSELHKNGVKLAVISNKDDNHVKAIVDKLLPEVFLTSDGSKPTVPRKPDPTALLNFMKSVGVSADKTAYVGDLSIDHLTAKAAGVASILVSWGYGDREILKGYTPDYLLSSPTELLEI